MFRKSSALALMTMSLVLLSYSSWADTFRGKVIGVTDGDTITILVNRKPVKVRLHGVDSPEKRQDFGQKAKQFTSSLVYGQMVSIEVKDRDRYGRIVGLVNLTDGRMLNEEIVSAGYAWWYRKYAPKDKSLERLEREAQQASRGLWSQPNPVEPWRFRKGVRAPVSVVSDAPNFRCGTKRFCKQMSSCREAMFFLNNCGIKRLDRDRDGIPCESICSR